jgi:hypothetical protein
MSLNLSKMETESLKSKSSDSISLKSLTLSGGDDQNHFIQTQGILIFLLH